MKLKINQEYVPSFYQVVDLNNNVLCVVNQTDRYICPVFKNLCEEPIQVGMDKPSIIKASISNTMPFRTEEYVNMNELSQHLRSEIKKEFLLKKILAH